jgi:hypothetical protein
MYLNLILVGLSFNDDNQQKLLINYDVCVSSILTLIITIEVSCGIRDKIKVPLSFFYGYRKRRLKD